MINKAWDLVIAATLVVVSGLVAGLTVGILGIDDLELRLIEQKGDPDVNRKIARVQRLLSHRHLVLVALLLVQTVCQETLPLCLHKAVPEWAVILLSVTFVLLFAEVLPQAICAGKQRIPIVRFFAPLCQVLAWILSPIAWPIAKALDLFVGEQESKQYRRADLKAVIRLHKQEERLPSADDAVIDVGAASGGGGGHHRFGRRSKMCKPPRGRPSTGGEPEAGSEDGGLALDGAPVGEGLLEDEVVLIEGALDLSHKRVRDLALDLKKAFALAEDAWLTPELRYAIVESGHSRLPVYRAGRPWHTVGVLYSKSLITVPLAVANEGVWAEENPGSANCVLPVRNTPPEPVPLEAQVARMSPAAAQALSSVVLENKLEASALSDVRLEGRWPLACELVTWTQPPIFVAPTDMAYDLLNTLQVGHSIAFVSLNPRWNMRQLNKYKKQHIRHITQRLRDRHLISLLGSEQSSSSSDGNNSPRQALSPTASPVVDTVTPPVASLPASPAQPNAAHPATPPLPACPITVTEAPATPQAIDEHANRISAQLIAIDAGDESLFEGPPLPGLSGKPLETCEETFDEDDPRATIALITVEDVFEELLNEEIYDEYDSPKVKALPAAVARLASWRRISSTDKDQPGS